MKDIAFHCLGVGLTYGNPVTNGGFVIGEYSDGLPEGWKGFNEEHGYKKDESVLMPYSPGAWGIGQEHLPGVYRSLQRTGHGAIARFLDVKGIVARPAGDTGSGRCTRCGPASC